MTRVLCAGHVNWDVTLRLDGPPTDDATVLASEQTHGGSAANVARALASLDVDAALVGSVGRDEQGRRATRRLESVGVDCRNVARVDGPTTVKYLLVDDEGERTTLDRHGVNEALTPDDVDDAAVRGADNVHLTSQDPRTASHIASVAREASVPVSFDPGPTVAERNYDAVIEHTTTLFCNEHEAELARDAGYTEEVERVVFKRGRCGARLERDEKSITVPACPVDAVDATGAGDAFAAGFLAARLRGDDERDALAAATACGAVAVQTTGAPTAVSWADVDRLLTTA